MTPADIERKLIEAAVKRRELINGGDTCCRIFNSSGDGLEGLTVDIYGGYVLAQAFDERLHGLEEPVARAARAALEQEGRNVMGVLWKDRTVARGSSLPEPGKSRLIEGSLPPQGFTVVHNGMTLLCDLLDRQNTGVFMDMRDVRNALEPRYGEMEGLLNLFSYTGAFTVHARLHGVSRSLSVDLARSAHRKAKLNHDLNGVEWDDRDFIVGDVGRWLEVFRKKGMRFPFVVYDPPTFARGKSGSYGVKRDMRAHLKIIGGIAAGGYVLTAVNTFSVRREEYLAFHPRDWELVFLMRESSDFRYNWEPYLKAGLWKLPVNPR